MGALITILSMIDRYYYRDEDEAVYWYESCLRYGRIMGRSRP